MRITIIGFILGVALGMATDATANSYQNSCCYEDESCWNWRTMGNQQRGITTKGGRHIVVNPVRFDRLNRAKKIDWKKTPRLRGD